MPPDLQQLAHVAEALYAQAELQCAFFLSCARAVCEQHWQNGCTTLARQQVADVGLHSRATKGAAHLQRGVGGARTVQGKGRAWQQVADAAVST